MIRALFAAKLLLDVVSIGVMAKAGNYAWAVVFVGLTVADAGTVWLLSSG